MRKYHKLRMIQKKFELLHEQKNKLKQEWIKESVVCPHRKKIKSFSNAKNTAPYLNCGSWVGTCDYFLCPILSREEEEERDK